MKIRFWAKENNIMLLVMSTYPILYVIGTYFKGEQADYTYTFLGTFLVSSVYFLSHYFTYILVLSDNDLLIRENMFERGVSINPINIKSITPSELNNKITSISFELYKGKAITWHTKRRTRELYERLINVNPEWQTNE
jgi:hypothetical protein